MNVKKGDFFKCKVQSAQCKVKEIFVAESNKNSV